MPLHPDEAALMRKMHGKVHELLANFKKNHSSEWVTLWRKLRIHWNALCDSVSAADFRVSLSKGLSPPTGDLYKTLREADIIIHDLMYAMIEDNVLDDLEWVQKSLIEMRTFLSLIQD